MITFNLSIHDKFIHAISNTLIPSLSSHILAIILILVLLPNLSPHGLTCSGTSLNIINTFY